jgi:zinc/manganese transport system ATP-binding protein
MSAQPAAAGTASNATSPGVQRGAENAVVVLEHAEARIGARAIWSDVSFSLATGEFTAVLGPNGSGKTTLLRVLLGQLRLSAGRATVFGAAPGRSNRLIGYLPQRRHFDVGIRIRGVDLVRLGLDGAKWGLPIRRSGRERVDQVVAMVGAEGYASRPIGRLSGGEQQRLLIAQALISRPSLLVLDEPLDSLDLPNQTGVAALLDRICREERVSVLLVAHDINPLQSYLDRVVYFGSGAAAVGSPTDVITSGTLSRLYGVPIEVLQTADGRLVVVGLPEAPAYHSDRHEHHEHP